VADFKLIEVLAHLLDPLTKPFDSLEPPASGIEGRRWKVALVDGAGRRLRSAEKLK